jgi:hypothetical protein
MSRLLTAIALVAILTPACKSSSEQTEPDPPPGGESAATQENTAPGEVAPDDAAATDGESARDDEKSDSGETSADATDEKSTTPSLAGTYARTHKIQVLGEGDREELVEVSDCLSLETVDDQRMKFDFELLFDKRHSCSMSGEASRDSTDSNKWIYTEKSDGVDCTLRIEVTDESIELRDEDLTCHRMYCGAQAAFDGVQFSRSGRSPEAGSCGGGAP